MAADVGPTTEASSWPAAEARLRGDMLAAGCAPVPVARLLADLAPAYAALHRARGDVPDDLLWALAAVVAHRRKKRQLGVRI